MSTLLEEQVAAAAEEDAYAAYTMLQARFGKGKRSNFDPFSADEQYAWEAITEAYQRATKGYGHTRGLMSLEAFVRYYGRAKFTEVAFILSDTISRGCLDGTGLQRHERDAIRTILMISLTTWMQRRNLVITPTTISQQMVNIVHAIQSSFPGYMDAQALRFVLRGNKAA